jgi:nitroreductase
MINLYHAEIQRLIFLKPLFFRNFLTYKSFKKQPLIFSAMRIKSLFLIILMLGLSQLLKSQSSGSGITDLLLSAYSEKSYSSEPVSDSQLDIILRCGIKAPSSRNLQPWKFTVIQDEATMKEIINNVVAGNIIIIISGQESQQSGSVPEFDCGLAAESMFIAAHGLGLGARIYGSPAGKINSKKEDFGIPEGYRAVVALRIGNIEKTVDAVSAATKRKDYNDIVNFRK